MVGGEHRGDNCDLGGGSMVVGYFYESIHSVIPECLGFLFLHLTSPKATPFSNEFLFIATRDGEIEVTLHPSHRIHLLQSWQEIFRFRLQNRGVQIREGSRNSRMEGRISWPLYI